MPLVSDLALRADPSIWSRVPDTIADADAWIAARLEGVPADSAQRVEDAARLALYARLGSELSVALLLSVPASGIFGMLGVLGLGDAPAPSTAAGAKEIAEALVPSPWGAELATVSWGVVRGWRATVLDPVVGDDSVVVAQTISTVYVLDLEGRCVVAALTPLVPLAAAAAHVLAERVLSTLSLSGAAA
ncbi:MULTISPECIES: hypothetical protein [Microbacterium]|jgi:hypothetical protein|uniref:hypothetical protein n=1 Tax=Microbacterium TaxID=33882 RepID=UPI000E7600FF|nr:MULTISPECIES: hypothetical protein [Microbacterium]RKE64262.1 hypothetical protein DEU36_1485 [Microbacterium sp. AG238]WJM16126.1 hypothetical protein QUC20_02090 [Microbacterium arborescens]